MRKYGKPETLKETIRLLHFAWTCPLGIDFQRGCEQVLREMRADRGWPHAAKVHTSHED